AGIVLRVEDADVKLVDDQTVERRRAKSSVVPDVVARIADDAVARIPGIAAHLELARVRIALEPFAPGADDVEAVEIAVGHAGHVACPEAARVLDEEIVSVSRVGRRQPAARTADEIDLDGIWRPRAEGDAAGRDRGAERRVGVDVEL